MPAPTVTCSSEHTTVNKYLSVRSGASTYKKITLALGFATVRLACDCGRYLGASSRERTPITLKNRNPRMCPLLHVLDLESAKQSLGLVVPAAPCLSEA